MPGRHTNPAQPVHPSVSVQPVERVYKHVFWKHSGIQHGPRFGQSDGSWHAGLGVGAGVGRGVGAGVGAGVIFGVQSHIGAAVPGTSEHAWLYLHAPSHAFSVALK